MSLVHWSCAKVVDPAQNFRIMGDDNIALWSSAQIDEFTRLSAQCGLIVNEKSVKSRYMGTFCEGDYVLSGGKRYRLHPSKGKGNFRRYFLDRLPTFSIRALVEESLVPIEELGHLWRRGVDPRTYALLQAMSHERDVKLAESMGIPKYAPRFLGGLGLVGDPDRPLDGLSSRMMVALHNGFRLWKEPKRGSFSSFLRRLSEIYSSWRYHVDQSEDPDAKVTLERAEKIVAKLYSDANYLDSSVGMISPDRRGQVSPGKVMRSLKQFRAYALKHAPKHSPIFPIKDALSLKQRLTPMLDDVLYATEVCGLEPIGVDDGMFISDDGYVK